jgi:D-arabinitol 4-dehydrogenase
MVENEAILRKQKCRYTLETINSAGVHEYSIIRSISNVVPWDQHLQGLVSVGKNPDTKIISFTVTEGGYYLNSTMDALDTNNQDIKHDLVQLQQLAVNNNKECKPVTIYGALALILFHRPIDCPITLMSCDNVRHNGI